jgi:hypothetical protein
MEKNLKEWRFEKGRIINTPGVNIIYKDSTLLNTVNQDDLNIIQSVMHFTSLLKNKEFDNNVIIELTNNTEDNTGKIIGYNIDVIFSVRTKINIRDLNAIMSISPLRIHYPSIDTNTDGKTVVYWYITSHTQKVEMQSAWLFMEYISNKNNTPGKYVPDKENDNFNAEFVQRMKKKRKLDEF